MRDVQHRLVNLHYSLPAPELGTFLAGTEAAVRAFQTARGLRADGVCGEQTWAALVEAGYRLGDRLVYLRAPLLRGDDVAALQRHLGALGFDAGRVDGIFGPRTEAALEQFQRNAAITVDGVCGATTLAVLERLGRRVGDRQPVTEVRELERLRQSPRTLQGKRIVVGDAGGMNAAAAATAKVLTAAGALVTVLVHPDQSEQAAEANAAEADAFVSLVLDPGRDGCASAHYAGHRYESPAGRYLAGLVQTVVPPALDLADLGVHGMALPVLRETRMPAVVCELGPPAAVVPRTSDLANALGRVLAAWVVAPVGEA